MDLENHRIILPVPSLGRSVFVGVEYDYFTNSVDVKLYDTSAPGSDEDMCGCANCAVVPVSVRVWLGIVLLLHSSLGSAVPVCRGSCICPRMAW